MCVLNTLSTEYTFRRIHFPENTLSREYTFQRIHFPENTLSREYTFQRIHFPENTLSREYTFQRIHFPENTLSREYTFQRIHFPENTLSRWAYGEMVSMFDFHRSDRVRIPVVAIKLHNVYNYTIEQHPWQVSENHKPRVHPNHAREIGYLMKHKIEL